MAEAKHTREHEPRLEDRSGKPVSVSIPISLLFSILLGHFSLSSPSPHPFSNPSLHPLLTPSPTPLFTLSSRLLQPLQGYQHE